MPTFPTEISIAIFSLLPPRDLPSVIRLSKTFLGIGRSLLYKSINLRSDALNIQSTILLFQQDTELCKNIKCATLTTRQSTIRSSWIPTNFFDGWDNLRSLKMIGFPFHSPEDQEIFRDNLIGSCVSLVHFTYQPGTNPFPGDNFGISGLKRLSWQTERATPLELQIISVIGESARTLTHISLTGCLSLLEPTCYYDFLDLQFPLLTSLELGSLFNTTSQERSNTAITRFIISHLRIRHLSLGKFRIGTNSFQFDGNLLSANSLPNLRSFEGFPTNITLLAHCNVRSLLELNTLSLFSDLSLSAELDDLSSMFEAVRGSLECGQFPCVRNLRFEFYTDHSHLMKTNVSNLVHRKWIDRFSEICPAVINWYGTLGPVNPENLANVFNLYDHLETINLPRLSLNLYIPIKDSAIKSYFRTIAEQFPMLRQLVARKPAYTELEDYVFCLRRGANGGDFDSVDILDGREDEWNLVDSEEPIRTTTRS